MPPPEARGLFSMRQYNQENVTKSPQPHLKYCTFKLNSRASIEYACFSHEICCIQGCCTGYYSVKTVQWQYWSPIIFCAIVIYFLSQYCMGSDKKRNRALEVVPEQSGRRCFFAQSVVPVPVHRNQTVPPDNVDNVNVDEFLEHLIQEYRSRYPDIECPVEGTPLSLHPAKPIGPPCYTDALHMPKPKKRNVNSGNTSGICQAQEEDALPTYENAISN